ncbi:MAG: DUF885 family protein [Alphaproteobacteria bacterium]|nr:DUF885 family protein [Alphaproteobacteria bacterium]
MYSRRQLLLSGSAAFAAAALPFGSAALAKSAMKPAASAQTPSQALNALFDKFVDEGLDLYPEAATSLGLDKGPRAHQRAEVSDSSLAGIEKGKQLNESQFARLKAFDRNSVSGTDAVSYDVVYYNLETSVDAAKRFNYGGGGAGAPYIISQLTGSYQSAPDFLDSQQPIETKDDAEAYLSRLAGFGRGLDQEIEVVKHDSAMGVVPPDFILSRALVQMEKLRSTPVEKSVLVESVVRRAKEKNIDGDWDKQAQQIVNEKVYPALDRQIALLKEMQSKAVHHAGVWRLPDGDAYYGASLTNWTTSTMKPEEIHQLGLDTVADLSSQIDVIMKQHGMNKGTVGERLRGMYSDKKFQYANTDEAKEKLLADLNKQVQEVTRKLPEYFGALPKAGLEIKRVPKYLEAGAPGGYYNNASLDGSRPGAYYINLRDTAEVPSWTLPTLTYHEGIPGHHLQLSLAQEASIPLIRKLSFFSAYIEGWALYAEQLAVEMGMYENDPWGHIGQLHDAMFRGVRLVVDTGMHAKHWSREQAIKYFVDTLGDQDASATTEVERYCVWPGQACSYMLGKITWLKLREKAKAELGAKFDIRKFHDAGLLGGALPLQVLEKVIDNYIAETKAA